MKQNCQTMYSNPIPNPNPNPLFLGLLYITITSFLAKLQNVSVASHCGSLLC